MQDSMGCPRKRSRVEELKKTVVISCDSDKPELRVCEMPSLTNVQNITGYMLQFMLRAGDVFKWVISISKAGVYREGGAVLVPFRYTLRPCVANFRKSRRLRAWWDDKLFG
jgi:hypothetical protein